MFDPCDMISVSKFSMGYIWQYWDWYKDKDQFPYVPFIPTDYGGLSPKQLYVVPKFADYKEEILHHIDMNMYNDIILIKANIYKGSNRVKGTKANVMCDGKVLHYGIGEGASITEDHIISMILYTDFSEYCTKFSATFRKSSPYETFDRTKQRNAEFAYLGRYDEHDKGPFYSGVNCVLTVPQFAIRLSAPTSTSKHIEVSMNFAKKEGMIITLNKTGHYYAFFCQIVRLFLAQSIP